jgi:hypothetical protein
LTPECSTQQLESLPFGTLDETKAQLDRRIELLKGQTLKTVEPLSRLGQANFLKRCFEQRLALLESYSPDDDKRREARKLANEFRGRWGAKMEGFLTGESAEAKDGAWWLDADHAFEELVKVERAIEKAPPVTNPDRDKLVRLARTRLQEFAKAIETVRAGIDQLPEENRKVWLRALAFRARNAALAVDRLQRRDLEEDPEGAYAMLMQQVPEGGHTSESALAGDLAPILARVRNIRASRTNLDAGRSRDMSAPVQRRQLLEELYLANHRAHSIVDDYIEVLVKEVENKRDELLRLYDLKSGSFDVDKIRAARQAEWKTFLADLWRRRDEELGRHGDKNPGRIAKDFRLIRDSIVAEGAGNWTRWPGRE